VPAVQDRPVLRRGVSESRLDNGWAQGDVWHKRVCACRNSQVRYLIRNHSHRRNSKRWNIAVQNSDDDNDAVPDLE